MKRKGAKKLVIVGGGTAGWIAAVALSTRLKPEFYEITIVDSSHINALGVGESLVPSVIGFIRDLGFDVQDFIEKTQATLKLGTQFRNWYEPGSSFFHPFGTLGCEIEGLEFYHCWLKASYEGDSTPLTDYAPAAVMANAWQSGMAPELTPGSLLAGAIPALHLDSSLMRQYLTKIAVAQHVKSINAHIVRVNQGEGGNIESLELNSRQVLQGDFFLDCTGFRGLLIDESLGTPYIDWKRYLPCDRVVTVQSTGSGDHPPYTVSAARDHGWSWQIPLRDRIGYGYVYSSDDYSEARAEQLLLETAAGEPLHDPLFIRFRSGVREQFWKKNCIAVGLAAGFLEPLESAAIHLAIRAVNQVLDLFPDLFQDGKEWPSLAAEFNTRMRQEYEHVRDFTVLHYCTTRRVDTEFWRRCQSNPIPDSLAETIELFRARGALKDTHNSLFQKSSWQAVLTGMGVTPHAYHPLVDMTDFADIGRVMLNYRTRLERAVEALAKDQEPLS